MQFRIRSKYVDSKYLKYLLHKVRESVREVISTNRYRSYLSQLSNSSVIIKVPDNLESLIVDSIVLTKVNDEYIIQVDTKKSLPGSDIKVSTLVRLLEYGNEVIRPYHVIRRVFQHYSRIYNNELFMDYMMNEVMK